MPNGHYCVEPGVATAGFWFEIPRSPTPPALWPDPAEGVAPGDFPFFRRGLTLPASYGWYRVIRASLVLTGDDKIVWDAIRLYDNDDRGCFLAPARLARLCGLKPRGLEGIRQRQVRQGILRSERRGMRVHWFVTLPEPCIPSARPTEEEVLGFAQTLDALISPTPAAVPRPTRLSVPRHTPAAVAEPTAMTGGLSLRGEGGSLSIPPRSLRPRLSYLSELKSDTRVD